MENKIRIKLQHFLKQTGLSIFKPTASLLGWLNEHGWIQDKDIYPIFSKNGFHILRKHYYNPIPEEKDLKYQRNSELIGIAMRDDSAFELLTDVLAKYKAEFNQFPVHKTEDPNQFHLLNGSFMAIDGNVYYSLIRHLKPKRIIEIGSGNSTLLAANAILKNKEDTNSLSKLTCVEPYPNDILKIGFPGLTKLIDKKVQEIDFKIFEELEAGDILFIDSSHVLRTGGDVWLEYCEILPRLSSGVYIHCHDISLPNPYPQVYFDTHNYWNEQYLLQAFLTFNTRFEVVWAGNYLMYNYPEKLRLAFLPEYDLMRAKFPSSEPTSFWMRVK